MDGILDFGENCGPTNSFGGSLSDRFEAAFNGADARNSVVDGAACGFHDFALEEFAAADLRPNFLPFSGRVI